MEWVETTGKTVEEALDAALDQLGVHEDDAEYEVIEEPKVGLFGRLRGEARVRARVRPTRPRPKEDRRDRRRRGAAKANGGTRADAVRPGEVDVADRAADAEVPEPAEDESRDGERAPQRASRPARNASRRRGSERREEDNMTETGVDVPLATQGEVAAEFLRGVVERFGVEGTVTVRELDDETVEVAVEGDDLGLLIGPRGTTLSSIQDLARTVVQRKTSARNGRLLVDVAGYRQKRKVALERFARNAAEQALATKARVVLEPMTAADRKVIHDTVNDIDGVSTISQGEEPRRRVVLLPEEPPSA